MRMHTKTHKNVPSGRKRSRRRRDGETRVELEPAVVFTDPVSYLRSLGLDAELVETTARVLSPAA